MDQPISPTVGRRCALVSLVGHGHDPLAKTPRGVIVARCQGNYTVQLEHVTDHVVEWCKLNKYPLSADGRVMGGPGRVRIISDRPVDPA